MSLQSFESDFYRYGFNGAERDFDYTGDHYDLGARHYDARLGKMLSIDPRASEYPWQSPYAYHRNCPILIIDFMGEGDNEDGTYSVEKGQGVSQIAVTLLGGKPTMNEIMTLTYEILEMNGLEFNDIIYPDQVLNLPERYDVKEEVDFRIYGPERGADGPYEFGAPGTPEAEDEVDKKWDLKGNSYGDYKRKKMGPLENATYRHGDKIREMIKILRGLLPVDGGDDGDDLPNGSFPRGGKDEPGDPKKEAEDEVKKKEEEHKERDYSKDFPKYDKNNYPRKSELSPVDGGYSTDPIPYNPDIKIRNTPNDDGTIKKDTFRVD